MSELQASCQGCKDCVIATGLVGNSMLPLTRRTLKEAQGGSVHIFDIKRVSRGTQPPYQTCFTG